MKTSRHPFANGATNMAKNIESIVAQLTQPSLSGNVKAVVDALQKLDGPDKKTVELAVNGGLLSPDRKTSNTVWLIIINAFSLVMIGAVSVLCISVFTPPVTGGTKSDTILTIFTTVTAFLAGLFAPSPVTKNTSE
jgi:hypothetical protein